MSNTAGGFYKVRVVNQNGLLLSAPASTPTVTAAGVSDLAVYSNTALMLANDATTYANAVAYVDSRPFVNTSQLSANLVLYQTTAGLSANVATLTSNNSTNFSGLSLATVQGQITGNAATAYSNSVAYVDSRSFVNTSSLAIDLAGYQTTAGLGFAVSRLQANSATFIDGVSIDTINNRITANTTVAYTNAVNYTDSRSFVNTSQLSTSLAPYQTTAGLAANVATLTANNSTNFGGVSLATVNSAITGNAATAYTNAVAYVDSRPFVNTSQLSANLTNYQTTAGLAANVATLTANNSTNFGGLSLATVQGQISGNAATAYANAVANAAALYQTSAGLSANVATLTANNSTNFGGLSLATVQGQITGNAATAYTNAVAYVDSRPFVNTSQLSSNLANYQTTAGLAANVATLTSNNSTNFGGLSLATVQGQITGNAATAYTNATAFSSNATNITGGTVAEVRLPFRMDQNVRSTDSVNFGSVTISGNLIVNGSYTVVTGNSVIYTDNMLFLNQGIAANITNIVANGTHIVFTANNNYQVGWDVLISGVNPSSYDGLYPNITASNTTSFTVANTKTGAYVSGGTARGQTESNPDIGIAAGYNDGTYAHTGIFRDHATRVWKVFDGYLPEPDASVYIDQTNASFTIAPFQASEFRVGNNTNYGVVNTTNFTGTSNNTLNLGGIAAASYVNTSQLSSNLALYQTTAGLSANVATLTSNNSTNFGGLSLATVQGQITGNAATAYTNAVAYVDSRPFVNTSQLSSNLANYQTTAGLAANVATLTANNSTNFGGLSLATVQGQITGNAAAAYTNATAFASNATNITSGTLSNARLPSVVNLTTVNAATLSVGSFVVANASGAFVNGNISLTRNNTRLIFATTSGANVYFTQQDDDNFVFYTTNTGGGSRPVFSVFANTDAPNQNSAMIFRGPVDFTGVGIYANNSLGSSGQILISNGSSAYWGPAPGGGGGTVTQVSTGNGLTGGPVTTTGTISVLANTGIVANTNGLFVNSAYIATLDANNSIHFNGVSLATVNSAITGNASTAYTNAVNYVTAQSFVNTAQLSANLALYQTSAGLSANVLLLTANNTTNFDGLSLATVQGQITGNAATAFTNATNFASNATNITTGTLPNARLSSAVVNTSGAFSYSGIQTYTANTNFQNFIDVRTYVEVESAPTISAGTLTLDLATSTIFDVALNSNITTLTINNVSATALRAVNFVLILTADGTARSVVWPASFRWPGNTAPTITSTNGRRDIFSFMSTDNGTSWNAFVSGQNL